MQRFTIPRYLYHGKNALSQLAKLEGERATIVAGSCSMKRGGFLDKAIQYLKDGGFKVTTIEGVESDPSVETVIDGAKKLEVYQPDWIVAIGGGSAIDAAKAMWIFYEYPDTKFEDLCVPFSFKPLRNKAKFCAIPSTSGTASEVTAFSVITDEHKGIKYPLADFEITPDLAIIDPALAGTMPKTLIAYTGMDALTHAVEAYVSTAHCDYTDAFALHAINLIFKTLKKSFNGDMNARATMHNAQCLAGMAFSSASLGIVHSMAHKTGAAYKGGHITHGCANAMYLPHVIKYNAEVQEAKERYAYIARFLGLSGETDDELVQSLITEIKAMNKALEIPRCIKEYWDGCIDEQDFNEKLSKVAANAILDACTLTNPRKPTQEEMEELLTLCYYGSKDDNEGGQKKSGCCLLV